MIRTKTYFWDRDVEKLKELGCEWIEVDGSVNRNPGILGIVGVYKPQSNQKSLFKYKGNRLTNQLMEMIAIYHGLELSSEDECIIVSDSLTTIKMLNGDLNIKNERLAFLANMIKIEFDKTVHLVHRKGHIPLDIIGDDITRLTKQYNKYGHEPNIEFGSLQPLVERLGW